MKTKDRHNILGEVCQRVTDQYGTSPELVEQTLFDTIYWERKRIEKIRDPKKARLDSRFYDDLYRNTATGSPTDHKTLLNQLVSKFAHQVVGHFDQRIYDLTTKTIPPSLNLLLNSVTPLKLARSFGGISKLREQLKITGDVEGLKRSCKNGTVVLLPTHVSNLDSILIGFALFKMGLPPFTFGAGLNLFSNKFMGFFMENLGAYKVDRLNVSSLYKDTLKTYAGCTMEHGYHNLFFPGGTRIRSGDVEPKIKMGLLGMTLDAYIHNLLNKKNNPDITIIPCTLNYQLVLEAETLVDDHLRDVGKSRYIIEDDEFSKPKRILEFVSKLFSLSSEINFVIGSPMDVFGNKLDKKGHSLDFKGRSIDPRKYVLVDGKPGFDSARDKEYIREMSKEVKAAFKRDTMLNSTNLMAYTVYQQLKFANPECDHYRLLRTGGKYESFPLRDIYSRLETNINQARSLASQGKLRLDQSLQTKDPIAIASEALAHLRSYHTTPAMERHGDRLFHKDRNLILYYQNRVESLNLFNSESA